MYNPAAFRETRPEVIEAVIAAHPLAALVTTGSQGLDATHIPLLYYRGEGVLRGHLARANSQWEDYLPGTEALAIFSGPQHYVTPAWYPSRKEYGKVVPTWNYVVIHARGPLSFRSDPEWLLENVTALTEAQEKSNKDPWRVADAPREFIENSLRTIIGVELKIAKLDGKWKVNQNRSISDREGVIAGLGDLDSPDSRRMAELVRAALEREPLKK